MFKDNKNYTEEDLLCYIYQLNKNWKDFKQWISDYRLKKTGSNEDGRYCVAISVTELLAKMEEYENRK